MQGNYSLVWLVSVPGVLIVVMILLDIRTKNNFNEELKGYFRYSYIKEISPQDSRQHRESMKQVGNADWHHSVTAELPQKHHWQHQTCTWACPGAPMCLGLVHSSASCSPDGWIQAKCEVAIPSQASSCHSVWGQHPGWRESSSAQQHLQ